MAIHIPGLIAIIVFYLLILGVGLWAARKTGLKKGQSNSEEVMLAGRDIGLLVGCFTITATWVGGGFINGSSEIIVLSGLVWCQAPVGYGLSLAFGGVFFADKMRRSRYNTMLDPFNRKYGDLMGALLYIPALLGEMFWSAAILSALGATLAVILDIDTTISIIISAGISLMYTLVGGLYSVAYTDVVQLICIFVGLWVSVPFAMTNPASRSIIVDSSSSSSSSSSSWIGEVATTDIGIYMDTFLLLIFGGIPWQVYFQRVLSARTVKVARILSFVGGFGCMFMAVPAVLIGAIAANTDWNQTAYDKQINGSIPSDELGLTLPLVLRYLTPDAVSFIGLGAVSAAVMSSTDSSLLSASSMFARNVFGVVYARCTKKKTSDRMTIWVMRFTQFAMACCACAMAITVKSIYYLFYLCSDPVFVILFPQLTCAVYLRDTNAYGSLLGFLIGLIFRLLGGEPGLGLPPTIIYPWYDEEAGQRFPFRALSMLISLVTVIGGSYLFHVLFKNGFIPIEYDIFNSFSDKPRTILATYATTPVEVAKQPSDVPADYQPYIADDLHERKVNLSKRGHDNPVFQPEPAPSHKLGNNGEFVAKRPLSTVTRL
ncbi:high affinity choline transporter 1-like [Haliotis cracherodii]|uniref:high affinity choline transporter 1-like n=1 Tax=Haliotis cracherodii TaxID=6455 RepID=UPI0039E7EB1D